jgi:hypothetical protein
MFDNELGKDLPGSSGMTVPRPLVRQVGFPIDLIPLDLVIEY